MKIEDSNLKILVIRFSSMGDVILTTSLLPNLKAHWPGSQIYFLTKAESVPLLVGNPAVDSIRIYDPSRQPFSQLVKELREIHFDVVIDLQGSLRSFYVRFLMEARKTVTVSKCTWERYGLVWFKKEFKKLRASVRERVLDCLIPLEVPRVNSDTQLFPDPSLDVAEAFGLSTGSKLIGVAPGAKHKNKRWEPARFAEVANTLAGTENFQVVIVGSKEDDDAGREVAQRLTVPFMDLTGWTTLRELVGVVSKMSHLVTNDSGIMHVGEAFGVPTVAIFGPTVASFGFAPYRKTSRMVEMGGLSCRPCSLHGEEECPLGHHNCMKDLTVETVLSAFSSIQRESKNLSVVGGG